MLDTAQVHADQIDYWNGPGGARWIANQTRRDLMLADFAGAALARAGPQAAEAVIDIGCGCGETSVALAEAVGPDGRVLAVDVSAPILSIATRRLEPYPWARTVLADAAAHDFPPASADLLFSRFGVMFFGDPAAAFANLRRALKPSGRLVFACWRTRAENPWMTSALEAVYRIVPRPPEPDPDMPGPFAFGDGDKVKRILAAAGFASIGLEPFDPMLDVSAGAGVEGAVQTAVEFGPAAAALADQPDEVKAEVVEALRGHFGSIARDGAVVLPAAVWIVSATPA